MKIDKRVKYLIGLDTETANAIIEHEKLDLTQSLVYDLGWVICDKKGNIYIKRSYVVAEIFLDKNLMNSAYYKEKKPKYWEEIKEGKRILASFFTIRKQFLKDIKTFGIETVFAHNASFDNRALNNTIRLLTGSKARYFLPYNVVWWDTLKMANSTIAKQKSYTKFCDTYEYKTNHKTPRNRTTAEILYRYISGNYDFEESHTGLEDVEIETQIMVHCFRQHKKMKKLLFEK